MQAFLLGKPVAQVCHGAAMYLSHSGVLYSMFEVFVW
jgi:putative intracellular protease/amidase